MLVIKTCVWPDSSILGLKTSSCFVLSHMEGYLLLLDDLPNWATITATTKATWIGWPKLPPSVSTALESWDQRRLHPEACSPGL